MEIRPLTPEDREAFRAIRLELFPDEDPTADWPLDEYFRPTATAVGAFDGEVLVGYAAAQLRSHAEGAWERPAADQRIAYLEEWYVRPEHRTKGVGRALVAAVEEWARSISADYLASDTEVGNEVSQEAHRALGFDEVETTVHFLKRLDPIPPAEFADATTVELRPLDPEAGRAIMRLQVAPSQEWFVAPNTVSLAQAFLADEVWVRGIFAGDEPVGFAMVSTRPGRCYLWRFMIDVRYQGRGYGYRAMELIIDEMRALGADRLLLSYVPAPGGPKPFYERLGFTATGEIYDGEQVAVLEL